ncbi:nuclear transport factor 2 family protein [Streptomyces sp. NPDC058683]|uniref:nuclear transport factor 2 family protein n=1 Tax=Streptomyces sp. NPDC058683 TaxID=3346597 RepID=UPI003651375F
MNHNELVVRRAYQYAEDVDVTGWVGSFTEDGTFTDNNISHTFRGWNELGWPVQSIARAFPDMHRELDQVYVVGNMVLVQLHLQGTFLHPWERLDGTFISPTGKRQNTPTLDMFELVDGRIKRFDCYPMGTVRARQLGLN